MNFLTLQITFLLLGFACPATTFGGLPVVPFAPEELAPMPENLDVGQATLPQLRAILTAGKGAAHNAGVKLVRAGDDATIQRLVYALKQGNGPAAEILYESASPHVVPYLLEEVAHGSMKRNLNYSLSYYDRVRVAATEIMAETLASIPGLPVENAAWLKELALRDGLALMFVPEKSKVLLEWWEHNGEAVLAGRASEATWLPLERKLTPRIYEAWSKKNRAKPLPPPPSPPPISREPPSELPLHVDESLESWAARVMDPKQRDVTWATVDYETGMSVKLDEQEMDALKTADKPLTPNVNQIGSPNQASPIRNSITSAAESGVPSSTPWSVLAVLIVAAGGLLWFVLKRRS